jgi:uncharacterized protein YkwD
MRRAIVLGGLLLALVAPASAQAPIPRAMITDGPSGEVTETAATFAFEATGPAPLARFECRLDEAEWEECTSPHAVKDLGGGGHAFEVRLQGPLTDPTPDRREWVVKQRTEVIPSCDGAACPSPLPEPPATAPPPAPPPPRADTRRDARGCAYAGNEPGEVSGARIRRAVRCLVNVERAERDLPPLSFDARLERAAAGHARDMVARRYFAHESPGGRTVGDRAKKAGYTRGTRYWTLGEVLAWLVRPRPTPVAVVDAWMNSPPHRVVLLHPSFREIGAAFTRGNPRATRGAGATFAAALGRRAR